jgi:E3 ubiquitin-protein ligase CCNP1IP1
MVTIGIVMQLDQETLKRKNEDLVQAFREKSRKQLQTQELYDKLKRRATMPGQVQNAASDAVDHTIQASVTANRYVDTVDNQNQCPPQPTPSSSMHAASMQLSRPSPDCGINMSDIYGRSGSGNWTGFGSSQESIASKCSEDGDCLK